MLSRLLGRIPKERGQRIGQAGFPLSYGSSRLAPVRCQREVLLVVSITRVRRQAIFHVQHGELDPLESVDLAAQPLHPLHDLPTSNRWVAFQGDHVWLVWKSTVTDRSPPP